MAQIAIADIFERFGILCHQERSYSCYDYLSSDSQAALGKKVQNGSRVNVSSSTIDFNTSTTSLTSKSNGIDEVSRGEICEWMFKVIDHLNLHREIVSISLNYLDRYLSKRIVNRKKFQLLAMTSLFLAIKLYGGVNLRLSSYLELSRNVFKTVHIAAMENSILWTLSWHLHPPTPLDFVRNFIILLKESKCALAVADDIREKAQFLTEVGTCNYYFTTRKPSSIGLASILATMEALDEITLPMCVCSTFLNLVRSMKVIDPFSKEVQECKIYLSVIYAQYTSEEMICRGSLSPNCVADVEHIAPQIK